MADPAPPVAFGTKAETLERLAPRLRHGRVLPLLHFSVTAWRRGAEAVLDAILAMPWADGALIIRSSALGEDGAEASMAGRYASVADVCGRAALAQAIRRVIASYGRGCGGRHRVLVQPMLAGVALSGVAFTREPSSGAPYLVVNAHRGADTAAVTGGAGTDLLTQYCHLSRRPKEPWLAALRDLAEELEGLLGTPALDIEFAFLAGEAQPVLLQARPLVLAQPPLDAEAHAAHLALIEQKIRLGSRPHPYLHGPRTVYGVMPDWNPAEIIGVRPRPLALSLYRALVTDSIWAYQRHNYGYHNLRSFPLLLAFHGLPYVDVRVSFNSFLPADIDGDFADRLVAHYIDRLAATPALHDKVEFEIVFSCYTFDLPQRIAALAEAGFSGEERARLTDSLRRLTNRIIGRDTGLWRADSARIEELERRRAAILGADLDPLSRVYWLLEDCKRYGTLPFAGLARAGFIANQTLRSLVAIGVLTEAEVAQFMAGVETVSGRMAEDVARLGRGDFLARYGHLRPGTYDILSPRYDEAPDRYFTWEEAATAPPRDRPRFALTLEQMRRVNALLAEHGLEHDVVGLFGFLEAAIRGREEAKFVFSRSLSDALSLLRDYGATLGFSAEDMAHADAALVTELYAGSADPRAALAESIAAGRARHAVTRSLVLPPLLTDPGAVWDFALPPTEPNYVTQGRAIGRVATAESRDLAGAIVMIPSADPGFDWIFSRGIAGFVTAYGGVNSHMAIRAAELGLPAVVGAGEALFAHWSQARLLEVDTGNRQVRVLR
ncbi:PEP/pyruvate-binding domain-containing protein [Paracraurococcus ruber]|uniref:Phosphoenolpyruvate synthase n=1 Tax=Paracraurococcus ruber TaxID=77675 RepID=A0ABS1CW12_9PROT|nr:PEP/pyruvate-binding domain-containing protein [Paracraurococcus ruber]MBK1658600.1 phosphoenolpyruvate synthase [Paracraurococcus ruber]TDG28504.1 phosphoenolpyruvate synthase [Paracraurococcus ruber]